MAHCPAVAWKLAPRKRDPATMALNERDLRLLSFMTGILGFSE